MSKKKKQKGPERSCRNQGSPAGPRQSGVSVSVPPGKAQGEGRGGSFPQSGNMPQPRIQPRLEPGKAGWWMLLARGLLVVAILGASYLAYVSISNGPVAGCGTGSGCDKVLQSRWAYWLGIPVSLPAILVYFALLAATVYAQKRLSLKDQQRAWGTMIILSVVVAGAALWFIGLQALVIKSFCKFCMTAHTCGLVASILCLTHIPKGRTAEKPGRFDQPPVFAMARGGIFQLIVAGTACLAGLIGGQLLVQKQRNVVKPFALISTNQALAMLAEAKTKTPLATTTNPSLLTKPPTPSNATAASPAVVGTNRPAATNALAFTNPTAVPAPVTNKPTTPPQPARGLARVVAPHLLSLYDGQFEFKLDEVPMIGSPDAPNLVVSMFDYTCHHCRLMHPMLREAQRRFSNQLGIVSLPMPMATNCNPAIPRYQRPHALACDYARLGLAVWRLNREAFHQFDDWLFTPEQVVPPDQAKQYAAQLVGADNLEKALGDEWITRQIHMNGYLYHTNYLKMGNGIMPELIIGPVISFGPLNSVQDLYKLLDQHLGLK